MNRLRIILATPVMALSIILTYIAIRLGGESMGLFWLDYTAETAKRVRERDA